MHPLLRPLSAVFLALALVGCSASDGTREISPREAFGPAYDGPFPASPPGLERKLARLYADKPEYLALASPGESLDRNAKPRSVVRPEYPASHDENLRGEVMVALIVDEQGRVRDPRVLESSNALFDEPALAAVRKWTFHPGIFAGAPVKCVVVAPIIFMPYSEMMDWKLPGSQPGDTAAALRVSR